MTPCDRKILESCNREIAGPWVLLTHKAKQNAGFYKESASDLSAMTTIMTDDYNNYDNNTLLGPVFFELSHKSCLFQKLNCSWECLSDFFIPRCGILGLTAQSGKTTSLQWPLAFVVVSKSVIHTLSARSRRPRSIGDKGRLAKYDKSSRDY